MEKISSIIPSSPRITTVDLKESGTARPGMPNFGRPTGESNIIKNSVVRSAHKAIQRHNEQMDRRTKDQMQADIAQKMSDSFFKSKAQLQREKNLVQDLMYEQMLNEMGPAPQLSSPEEMSLEGVPVKEAAEEFMPSIEGKSAAELTEEELNSPGVGRYLDVIA